MILWLALAFDIFTHKHVLTVIHNVGELCNPVAKDYHSRLARELEVDLYMTMAIYEIIHIGMGLDIFLGIEHEMLAILAHIRRFLVVVALHATVLGPCQS